VTASRVAISSPDSFLSSEKGVDIWMRCCTKHFSEWARSQKTAGIYFTNKQRAKTLQPNLEFDKLKRRLKCRIFKCISWLNDSFQGGNRGQWSRFSERSNDLSTGTNFAS
jgi:hypothetical protein